MEENKLTKYEVGQLQKVGHARAITNKLLSVSQKSQVQFFLENLSFFRKLISKHYPLNEQLLSKYKLQTGVTL